jgi:hypothetical protein
MSVLKQAGLLAGKLGLRQYAFGEGQTPRDWIDDNEFYSDAELERVTMGVKTLDDLFSIRIGGGGQSRVIERDMSGIGGDRFWSRDNSRESVQNPYNDGFAFSVAKPEPGSSFQRAVRTIANFGDRYHLEQVRDWEERRSGDHRYQINTPEEYRQRDERQRADLIGRYKNIIGSGTNFGGHHYTEASLQQMSMVELASMSVELAASDFKQKSDALNREIGNQDVTAYSRKMAAAQIELSHLPANLAMLAKSNPLLAGQLIDEYLDRREGKSTLNTSLPQGRGVTVLSP